MQPFIVLNVCRKVSVEDYAEQSDIDYMNRAINSLDRRLNEVLNYLDITSHPTFSPTSVTENPTNAPTHSPTLSPTPSPTQSPTPSPTSSPTAFTLSPSLYPTTTNNAPFCDQSLLGKQTFRVNEAYGFSIQGACTDPDGDTLEISATRMDNSPLPSWLNFIELTSYFYGTPHSGDEESLIVFLTATDPRGMKAYGTFVLEVQEEESIPE